ncbi:MAG: stage III sporulation protein AD [Clostridia bacterium]|nr:stage III sporulation protein AD [Clostridia bacterium]MBR5226477.1 stage III sporulation protein AD [Clostridia bacterium]
MDIFKILAIAILTCIASLIVKQVKPDFASLVTLAGGVVILLLLIGYISSILDVFKGLIDKANLSPTLFSSILKIIGIGYLTEFTANLCSDTGNSSLASKVGLAGKIIILFLSLPIITNLLEVIMGILP